MARLGPYPLIMLDDEAYLLGARLQPRTRDFVQLQHPQCQNEDSPWPPRTAPSEGAPHEHDSRESQEALFAGVA